MQHHQNLPSSSIDAIAYDAKRLLLVVCFKNGGFYEYRGVHDALVADWLSATSIGSFYSREVRGQFKGRRIERGDFEQFLKQAEVHAPVVGIDPSRHWLTTLLATAAGTPGIVF